MSDDTSPNGTPGPYELEASSTTKEAPKAKRRPKLKTPPVETPVAPAVEAAVDAAPAAAAAIDIPVAGAPPASERSDAAPSDVAGPPDGAESVVAGEEAAEIEITISPGRPPVESAPIWGAGEAVGGDAEPEAASPGDAAADSLYEVELEIRNRVEQSSGQAAEMGTMAAGVLQLVGDNLRRMTEEQADRVTQMLRGIDLKDYLDPAFWQGIGMVLKYQVDEVTGAIKRRIDGQYTTDPYGMDPEAIAAVRPFLRFMYRTWWRTSVEGLENVPAEGRALLVANHSGVLPWDGAMIAAAVAEDHPAQNERILRSLHLHWFSTLPFVAPALAAMGQVPGLPENAVRLLENDELVCVFPEGLKGVGKLYKDRYKLARFGRGGFVQVALRAQAPIVPVAVVGAEEIYPMLANAEPLARLLGMPYFPITPFFPWFGPLGVIPLPTRWSITFCEPLRTDEYDPASADDPLTVLGLTEMVRERIQGTIDAKLAARKSVF